MLTIASIIIPICGNQHKYLAYLHLFRSVYWSAAGSDNMYYLEDFCIIIDILCCADTVKDIVNIFFENIKFFPKNKSLKLRELHD